MAVLLSTEFKIYVKRQEVQELMALLLGFQVYPELLEIPLLSVLLLTLLMESGFDPPFQQI